MRITIALSVPTLTLGLSACSTAGAYVSQRQQLGYGLPAETYRCESRCRAQDGADVDDYTSCLARCPDVVFVEGAACRVGHVSLCQPDSRVDAKTTAIAVPLGILGAAASIAIAFLTIAFTVGADHS